MNAAESILHATSPQSPDQTDLPADKVSRKALWFWGIVIVLVYALPWSNKWYPLSDSSLYLSLGRSWSQGHGLTMMGDPVKLVPPLTPMFLGTLMKLGAGIGAIQAVMSALMLVAHALCFLTLSRWMRSQRLALGATVGCALSYWVFANAFTIMSEPLCIALMWGGFLALSHVDNESPRRWALVIVSCILLLLAAANRDAVLCLLPGPLLALGFKCRFSRQSIVWGVLFAVVFSSWAIYRYPPKFLTRWLAGKKPAATQPLQPTTVVETEDSDVNIREGKYRAAWLQGIARDHHLVTEPPVLGGRWVLEGMAMPSVIAFETNNNLLKVAGTGAALLAFALVIAGGVLMFRRGHWWVIGPALYFGFIWLQWGTRIKPRYMIPIAPILFLFLWHGLTWAIVVLRSRSGLSRERSVRMGRIVMGGLLVFVVAGNCFPWAVEVYIRHFSHHDFYDVARRGAYAQLVDIGNYIQKSVPADQKVWTNAGAHRRIAYFLCGHKIETNELSFVDWSDLSALVEEHKHRASTPPSTTKPATRLATAPATRSVAAAAIDPPSPRRRGLSPEERRKRFFRGVDKSARYIIFLVDHPSPRLSWPAWHWPTRPEDRRAEWWRLYERQPDETWKQIHIPRGREYVESIPAAVK